MSSTLRYKILGDVCVIKPPKKEAKTKLDAGELVSFVPMDQLKICTKNIGLDSSKPLESVYKGYTYFSENDVLLAKITPCFENGKLGIARDLINEVGFGSSEFIVFRCGPEIYPDYLFYYLSQDSFRRAGQKVMTGAVGHKRVPKEFIELAEIFLPTLPEQKRIVAILDEAFAGIDRAIVNTEKNLASARETFESYLNEVFTRKGVGWEEKTLNEVCNIRHGFAFKSEYFTKSGRYVLLTPGSFYERGGFRDQGEKTKFYQGEIAEGYLLSKGDFLIAMTEQAVGLLGSTLVVPESGIFLHNQRLGLVEVKEGIEWVNDFFHYQFSTLSFRQSVQTTASGLKVRHTSPAKLGVIRICFPKTRQEQKLIANKLNDIARQTRALDSVYRQKLYALNELKQSLLQKAFSGELTADMAANAEAAE